MKDKKCDCGAALYFKYFEERYLCRKCGRIHVYKDDKPVECSCKKCGSAVKTWESVVGSNVYWCCSGADLNCGRSKAEAIHYSETPDWVKL